MAVFKQVNIKMALRKISSGLGYTKATASEFPWQDAVEWIGEALNQIGSYTQYDAKEVTLKVENYKSKLPCDFIHLKRMLNMSASPTGQRDNGNSNLIDNEVDTDEEQAARLLANSNTDHDFNIILDNIITSYKEGTLTLQYLAMPIDEEGFPYIPDNESYKEAFFWYVANRLAIRGQLKNKELSVQYCDAQWQWYCGQARAEGNAFTHAQLDWIAADNLSMLPLALANTFTEAVTARGTDSSFDIPVV